MKTSKKIKNVRFVQITGVGDDLYGLDKEGRVWSFGIREEDNLSKTYGWWLLVDESLTK